MILTSKEAYAVDQMISIALVHDIHGFSLGFPSASVSYHPEYLETVIVYPGSSDKRPPEYYDTRQDFNKAYGNT